MLLKLQKATELGVVSFVRSHSVTGVYIFLFNNSKSWRQKWKEYYWEQMKRKFIQKTSRKMKLLKLFSNLVIFFKIPAEAFQ